jgi:thioredoxin 1
MSIVDILNFQQFEELLGQNKYVIVKFSAEWCGPCKRIHPLYESKCEEYSNVCFTHVDVDHDEVKEICEKYSIKGMPTFILFENDVEIYRFSGAKNEELNKMLSMVSLTDQNEEQ